MDILNQFGINPLLLGAQVVNFLILLFILRKFLYGPILKVLAQRKETIAQSLKNSEEIEKKLLKISEEEQVRLREASLEGEKLIKQAGETAAQFIEEGKKKAEVVSQKMIMDTQESLKLEREKMQQQIREDVSKLIVSALYKVTGKTVSKEDEKNLIAKAIKELDS